MELKYLYVVMHIKYFNLRDISEISRVVLIWVIFWKIIFNIPNTRNFTPVISLFFHSELISFKLGEHALAVISILMFSFYLICMESIINSKLNPCFSKVEKIVFENFNLNSWVKFFFLVLLMLLKHTFETLIKFTFI